MTARTRPPLIWLWPAGLGVFGFLLAVAGDVILTDLADQVRAGHLHHHPPMADFALGMGLAGAALALIGVAAAILRPWLRTRRERQQ